MIALREDGALWFRSILDGEDNSWKRYNLPEFPDSNNIEPGAHSPMPPRSVQPYHQGG